MTKTKNYWLAAFTKNGGATIMHHCVASTLDQVSEYAHTLLEEDPDIEYCVPVLVTQSPLDIEIRRPKK